MKLKGILIAIAGVAFLGACADSDNVGVNGRFAGHSDGKVYLEQVLPGNQMIVDSAQLGKKGDFRLSAAAPDNRTTLYNLRFDNDVIPLLLSPGERVTVNSICDVGHNYTVDGSPESERLRELKTLLEGGAAKLDSLREAIIGKTGDEQKQAYIDYVEQMQRVMQEHISFIVTQPHSLSSLYALYQRLPHHQFLFNRENDILYYRMVADSTEKHHPESPYVIALRKEIDDAESKDRFMTMISDKLASGGDNYPDLYLPDMHGNKHRLSESDGKVILLDFWLSTLPSAKLNNAELKKLYDEVGSGGFEVYQVALDTQKAQWVVAVQGQRLPWVSVCDFQGDRCVAARTYNISKVPANYLIDRSGNIVGRDLYGDQLVKAVRKLL